MFKNSFKIGNTQPRIRLAFCFATFLTALLFCGSSAFGQLTLAFAPEYYYWQENANGAKLLDESGIRYGLELSYKQEQDEGWIWAGRFKVYYGSLDYNGQTFGGTSLKTTSEYYGGLAELRTGYRWDLNDDEYLDLMGGLGLEDWLRSLNGTGGYDENWLPIYAKAGFELCPENESGWLGTLGVKVPIYTWQMVDLSRVGGGSFTLHPGSRPSAYAEAGYQYKRLSLVAYFDSYWFAQSPVVEYQGIYVYQPESLSFEAGLKVGWTF
jgi:hypothetical protein